MEVYVLRTIIRHALNVLWKQNLMRLVLDTHVAVEAVAVDACIQFVRDTTKPHCVETNLCVLRRSSENVELEFHAWVNKVVIPLEKRGFVSWGSIIASIDSMCLLLPVVHLAAANISSHT